MKIVGHPEGVVNGNEALGDRKNCNRAAFDQINVILKAKIDRNGSV